MIFPTPPLVKVDSKSTWVTNLAEVELSRTKLSWSHDFRSQLTTSQVVATLLTLAFCDFSDKEMEPEE